jgi:DNA (cytosine-5)-methyltransferase 1
VRAAPHRPNGSAANGHRDVSVDLRRPLAVDLFAGAGGLAVGLEQAGFDVVAAVEYDPVHAATHAYNFPLTDVLCRKAEDVTPDDIRAAAERGRHLHGHAGQWDGRIDLLVGGPPCQGFSLIGKRLVDDPRNQLVFRFFELVRDLRPRYFVMENVPGMKIGGHSSILAALMAEFEAARYQLVKPVRVLDAADFGVPQRRKRVFLLGADADEIVPKYPDARVTPVDARAEPTQEHPLGPTVWDAIGDLPDIDDFDELWLTDEVVLPEEKAKQVERAASEYARHLRGAPCTDTPDLSHPRRWNRVLLTGSMRTNHTQVSVERFDQTEPGTVEPISRFLRLAPNGLCNTLRAGTGSERGAYTSPRPIHPTRPRVISVREAARLHSFPDWFRFHRTKWHGFRQVGNAVAPLVARSVGFAIAEALGATPRVPARVRLTGSPELLELNMQEAAEHFGVAAANLPRQRNRAASARRSRSTR